MLATLQMNGRWALIAAAMLSARLAAAQNVVPPARPAADVDVADLGRLPFRIFTDRDGLPQNSILKMALDHKGYLWVGTLDGAARYDGRRWTVVNMPDRTISNQVTALVGAGDGSVWFGTDGAGLARLKDGHWTRYDASAGLPGLRIRALAETITPEGSALWVGTADRGLARFADGRFSVVDTGSALSDPSVSSVLPTRGPGGPVLWVGTASGGLARLAAGRWTAEPVPEQLARQTILSLLETREDAGSPVLWVGTNGGLGRLQDGRWDVIDTRSGLPSNRVEAVVESQTPSGRVLWVACYAGGLARLENGRWTSYGARSGLPTTRLRSLLETRASDGSRLLWVGTAAGGLARLAGGRWITFDTQSGLPNNIVRGFLETGQAIWLATAGGGIARFEGGRWQVFDTASGLPSNFVHALALGRGPGNTRAVWAGTDAAGLALWSGGRFRLYAGSQGLPSPAVQTLWPSTNEKGEPILWAGTDGGLARLEAGRWTVHTVATGLPHDVVTTLRETQTSDGARVLWVGTVGGLGRLEDGRWTRHDRKSGLANDNVRGLLETRTPSGARILWVGTLGGLSWADLGAPQVRWQSLNDSTSPALPNNVVYQVREDARGRIYLFTNKGVARLTPQWRTPLESSSFGIETFGSQDGLPAEEFNSGASLVDSRGRVWAGSTAGAVMLDPSLDPGSHTATRGAPAPLDVGSSVAGRTAPLLPDEALAHDGDVQFEYTLLSFFRESDTRYCTQLVGLEASTSSWSADYRSRYGRLPQGAYVFRAWARDYAGTVSGPVEVPFSIRPAPWRTWWAYGLYALAFVGAGSGALQLRLRALARRNRELEAQVRERTAELQQGVGWLRDAVKRAETLRAATEALSQSLDLPLVLQLILTELRKVVAYDSASVQELEGKTLRIIAGVGFPNLEQIVGLAFDVLDEGAPNGEVIRSRAPRIVADTEAYPMFRTGPHRPAQIRSWMGVPLLRGDRLIGIITLDKHEPDFYTKDDAGLAAVFAAQAAISIENARLFDQSQRHSAELEGHAAELEQAAHALRESEERTRAVVEKAHDAFIAMDRNGVITGWNAQAEAIFGWPRAEAIGRRVADVIIPKHYREDHVRGLERFLTTGEGPALDKRIELKALHRDGREFPVELTISAVRFSSGPIFSAFVRDITERRRAELRLKAQHAATRVLAEATLLAEGAPKILQAICESLGWVFGAFWQVDTAAERLRCVATWHEPSVELPEFEAITRKTAFLRGTGLPGRIWQTGQSAWIQDVVRDTNFPRAKVAAKEGLHGAFGFPVLSQGDMIGVLEFFSPEIQQPDPDLLAMMASVGSQLGQFIERKHAEEAVVKARQAAEDASRAKSAFVASMSHELRTPLNAILGFVQVMQRRQRDAEDKQHLAIISRSGEHLLGLINEVLSLSKIESGRMTLQETAFEIRELLDALRAMFQARASSRGLAFEMRTETELPTAVVGDEVKLRQILINLLGNAFKFTQAGSVTLLASWRDGRAVFEVADSGPGMSEQELASLFTAFTQASAGQRAVEGTGLGLAISRNYARLMGGDVTASSELGRGSRFRVEVKLGEATEAAARTVTGRRVRGLAPGQPRRLLLVADDSLESRMALSRLLASAGFDVLEAVDGEEAVLVWRRDRPDLIFMDVSMPVLDGLAATAMIRAEERSQGGARTPILAVTASAFDHEREAILNAGFDGFIAKPFHEDEIYRLAAAPLGVEYVYDEPEPVGTGAAGGDGVMILEQLENMPSDWLERFRDAMVQGDIAGALRLLGEIGGSEARLAEELRARLKSYRLDEIEAMLKI